MGLLMKIAMLGHKQFPTRSGGVEVVVMELASRLAERGHDVTVYDRGKIEGPDTVMGVHRVGTFTFKRQSLNAFLSSFFATFKILFKRYDIVHYHAIGPSVPLFLAHLFRKRTVSTIHGLNWRVDKWGRFAKKYLMLGEKIAAKYADAVVVLSEDMHRYFLDTYGRDTTLIENGVSEIPYTPARMITERFGLQGDDYILYVGRISPEKGPQDLIEGFKKSNTGKKLVIAGEVPENEFGAAVKAAAEGRDDIIFAGFSGGELLYELYSNCALYVLPSHTEGLALTLLEAMSLGTKCLVSDIEENTCVLGDYGYSFKVSDTDDLGRVLDLAVAGANPDPEGEKEYVRVNYSYDRVVDQHEAMYASIIAKNKKGK
jgi:glycosyltransferase involved in cell wall biosynthesis